MYKAAVNVDENFHQSRFHLGRVLAQIYSYTEAIKNYSRVINIKSKDDDAKMINLKMFIYLDRGITSLAID